VFESVVPSERTRLSVKVVDSSVRALCPNYPGSLILHVGELDFSSVMVGSVPETNFSLDLQALSLLVIDDLSCSNETLTSSSKATSMSRLSRSGGGIWKVLNHHFTFVRINR
jgi:autophagy-related protein 2